LLQADNVTFRYHADTPLVVDGVSLAELQAATAVPLHR